VSTIILNEHSFELYENPFREELASLFRDLYRLYVCP